MPPAPGRSGRADESDRSRTTHTKGCPHAQISVARGRRCCRGRSPHAWSVSRVRRVVRHVDHDGTWLSGVNGRKFGLIMPGRPLVNARYYQEVAPKVAMDRATILSVSETVKTPAGEFTNCLKVEETTPLERFVTEYKYYAPGIGMVRDGSLRLVKVTRGGGGQR